VEKVQVLTKGDRRWRSSAGDENGKWWRTPAAGRGGILHGKVRGEVRMAGNEED
jgi:hypothetical protein